MKKIGPAFIDNVSGKQVYYFEDRNGTVWMKESRWSRFKVKSMHFPGGTNNG